MQKLIQIFTLLPALIQAIRAAEDAIPLPRAGREKLELVLGIIDDVADATAELKPIVARIVARVVSTFNALGIFQRSAQQ